MAIATCTLIGAAHYNGGWIPSSGYEEVGSRSALAGSGRYYCMQFLTPTVTGSLKNRSITFTFDLVSNGASALSLNYAIATEGRGTNTTINGIVIQGSWSFSGITAQHQQFTVQTETGELDNNTNYYLWLWGDTSVQLYKHNTYYSATLNYSETAEVEGYAIVETINGRKKAKPYRYINGTWQTGSLYAYDSNTFKITVFDETILE